MAETIKDFLVSVGFKVDGSSERKFTDAIRSATLQADLLARGLEGAAIAIAKAVASISAGFESVYYTAQRANTSVSSLRAMTYALSQLGTSAGSAQSSLSNFGRRLATDPGAESMLKAIGVRTRDASGKLRDTTKLFEEFGRVTQKMPTYVALGYAQQLGVDEDTMRAMREQPELLARLRHEQEEYARSIGMNQDEAARKGQQFMQSLRRLQMVVTLVSEKILSELAPAMKAFVDQIIEWIRQNPDAIRDGLVQIGAAATDFAKACIAIAKELAPVIAKIGEMAGSITGHGGLQGTMELFAAFMVGSWALRIVGAITSVSTAWGALMLRLGIPLLTAGGAAVAGILATSVATDRGVLNAAKPGVITRSDDENTGAADSGGMFDAARRAWRAGKRILGGGGAEAHNRDDGGGISGRGGAGIRQRGARATEIDKTNYNFSGENADVLKQAAKELGTSPKDLATVISYETGGKFSPSIRGGKNNKYIGLIQFGPTEQRDYDANQQQSFKEQMPAVVRYLKHRGFKPGMGLNQLYATINGGRPDKSQNASDGNGTIAQHVERMRASHSLRADRFLASGTQQPDVAGAAKDMGKLMSPQDRAEADRIEAAKAEATKARTALTEAQRDAQDREKRERWQAVYRATGDAAKADEAARTLATRKEVAEAPEARRPTFSPAFGADKAPPLTGPTHNSRSASLTQNNTFNVQGGEARQTADLVVQGQKSVGTFGLEGIKSAIR
ncbi:phage tail tape measure protein [Methylobacterium sp. ARG-1]|uniref:phage tail tape measure protein n=1 Tax=Methylobacterium sp. ARG-1 TaxID=1692501 RepID=UPI000680032F|nr:phage tail tape measure protein [Methylobacterium sp. ARG-1]KNY19140.1 hypothetical protein AKJ13_29455 [Methylobacterium sp. ARG-1]